MKQIITQHNASNIDMLLKSFNPFSLLKYSYDTHTKAAKYFICILCGIENLQMYEVFHGL